MSHLRTKRAPPGCVTAKTCCRKMLHLLYCASDTNRPGACFDMLGRGAAEKRTTAAAVPAGSPGESLAAEQALNSTRLAQCAVYRCSVDDLRRHPAGAEDLRNERG